MDWQAQQIYQEPPKELCDNRILPKNELLRYKQSYHIKITQLSWLDNNLNTSIHVLLQCVASVKGECKLGI